MRPAAGLVLVVALAATAFGGPPDPRPRVVVLGFDGAAADRTERLMAEGRLPNLAALRERGGYLPLRPTNPAQSPVSWATLTTGWNPGKTGIYDFLRRRFAQGGRGVSISIGLAEAERRPPLTPWARAGIVFGAGALGTVLAVGLALGLLRALGRARPKGLLQGAATGGAAVLAAAAYVALGWVPQEVAFARNLRSGESFWVTLDRAGVRCEALEAPCSFPADCLESGACLAGLGVPDLQGTWGTFAMWTDDPSLPADTETGGVVHFVEPRGDGGGAETADLVLAGPPDPLPDEDEIRAALKEADVEKYKREAAFDWPPPRRRASETREAVLRLRSRLTTTLRAELRRGTDLAVELPDGARHVLRPGEWSELLPVTFRASPLVAVHGRVRLLLEDAGSAGPEPRPFRLFAAPVQFDPSLLPPNVRISEPPSYAADMARAIGPFETLGWPEMTNPVKDGVLEDRFFLSHLAVLRANREKRLLDRIARGGWDCLFAMFCEPDRVQHVLWRHVDPKSPRHDPAAAPEFAGAIDASYVEMDRIVGEVAAAAGEGTTVLVVSDHGFQPFRRGVNLNNFLVAHGFQARGGPSGPQILRNLQDGKFFADVDWTRTQAYAMGLGNVYLNLKGREPGGVVDPRDAERVLADVERKLLALRDADGSKVVRRVFRGKDLYHGGRIDEAPDLVIGFEAGYRVSWQTCLGALDADVIVDNMQSWTADHCSVDPELCDGILFSSRPLAGGATPGVEDVAPSVLSLYGVAPVDPDGKSFLAR